MRKQVLFLSLVALSAMWATARSLNPSEALSRALGRQQAGVSRSDIDARPVMTVETDGLPTLYVFDKAGKGYVIVSADDVAAPFIGYS
ncbi:MAG: Spi family protease inhibitor, partial [Duncaniella sp.]|nr:Spi family protease inhibitor [Duncaniella sp.]